MFGTVNFFKTENGMVGVRPSDISLSGGDSDFSFEGKIADSRSMGAGWLCVIEGENGDSYEARILGEETPDEGTHKFFVPQACLMLFKD